MKDEDYDDDSVYIGRGSEWGNPYIIGEDGTRAEVIEKYNQMIIQRMNSNPYFRDSLKEQLKGKDLLCFCAPKRCHGEILLKIANSLW